VVIRQFVVEYRHMYEYGGMSVAEPAS